MARSTIVDTDRGFARFMEDVESLADITAKVGVLADTAEGGLHEPGGDLTVGEIAAVNEFGTEDGHVPERSFVRSTFDRMQEELGRDAEKLVSKVLDGVLSAVDAVGVLGAKLAAEMKKTITTGPGIAPPNAPSTVARKGSSRPLVDTARMIGAITWAVIQGKP